MIKNTNDYKTPSIRANKSSNSRRGIDKLTARTIKTYTSRSKYSDTMYERKHKKGTQFYVDEDFNVLEDVNYEYEY
jgi:hypothetical protein